MELNRMVDPGEVSINRIVIVLITLCILEGLYKDALFLMLLQMPREPFSGLKSLTINKVSRFRPRNRARVLYAIA